MKNFAITAAGLSKIYRLNRNKKLSIADSISSIFSWNKNEYFYALKDVDFQIEAGDSVGLIGRNGAGKSTLLKILSNISPPSNGKVLLNGRVISLLEIGTGFHRELTGRENVYFYGSLLGMKKSEINTHFDKIVDFSGIEKFLDLPLKNYSSGMRVRLAFSVAVMLHTDILILDEVFAVGDSEFQQKCTTAIANMSANGTTILLASHDMSIILQNTNSCLYLDKGLLLDFGPTSPVCSTYMEHIHTAKSFTGHETIKNAVISYQKGCVTISVDLQENKNWVSYPNIGFVIYNSNFAPITGSNMAYEGCFAQTYKKGPINIEIVDLGLANGHYYASLWLADGYRELEHLEYCLNFSVVDSKENIKNTGPIRKLMNFSYK